MTNSSFAEFEDAEFSRLRAKLLRRRGSRDQIDFLTAACQNGDFASYLRSRVNTTGVRQPDLYDTRLTEHEFMNPPASTEAGMHGAWQGLTPRIACRSTYWANLTLLHIEEGILKASFLAARGNGDEDGVQRLERVLGTEKDDNTKKEIDSCVRTVLRRLGGLREVRGNRSVYVDCPLARAWWRERLVREASNGEPGIAEQVRVVVRQSQAFWEELVSLIVSRNSVLGSARIRISFILSLADHFERAMESPLRKAKAIRAASRVIGIKQASLELSVLDQDELRRIMDDLVTAQHDFWISNGSV